MALTRLRSGVCVANLHVSTKPSSAENELLAGAEIASDWAATSPLIFGGDFNVRPKASEVFGELGRRFGLGPPTAPDRLSHLLSRGLVPRTFPAGHPLAAYLRLTVRDRHENDRVIEAAGQLSSETRA